MLPLETPRLTLRRLAAGDLAALVAYRSDPEVARYQSWQAPYSAADGARLIAAMQAPAILVPGEWFQIAIARRDSGELIGDCGVCVLAEAPARAEIGFTLARSQQGRGFATEAVGHLIDALFGERGLEQVQALCDIENAASVRLLERLGLELVARFTDSFFDGSEWRSEYAYAVSRERWRGPARGI